MSVIVITSVRMVHLNRLHMTESILHSFFKHLIVKVSLPVSVIVSRAVCHKK